MDARYSESRLVTDGIGWAHTNHGIYNKGEDMLLLDTIMMTVLFVIFISKASMFLNEGHVK